MEDFVDIKEIPEISLRSPKDGVKVWAPSLWYPQDHMIEIGAAFIQTKYGYQHMKEKYSSEMLHCSRMRPWTPQRHCVSFPLWVSVGKWKQFSGESYPQIFETIQILEETKTNVSFHFAWVDSK